jgi:hypothetical protein
MALRLEKAFGAKSQELLKLQATYDEFQARERAKQIAVPVYTPGFIQTTAAQLEEWADRHREARHLLPALSRRLILTTGDALAKVDFPAFDNAERPGWEGQIQAEAPPWIPAGLSGWEFGADVRQKANDDYKARVTSVPAEVRKNTTFVFLTPRNWPRTRAHPQLCDALGGVAGHGLVVLRYGRVNQARRAGKSRFPRKSRFPEHPVAYSSSTDGGVRPTHGRPHTAARNLGSCSSSSTLVPYPGPCARSHDKGPHFQRGLFGRLGPAEPGD